MTETKDAMTKAALLALLATDPDVRAAVRETLGPAPMMADAPAPAVPGPGWLARTPGAGTKAPRR